MTRRWLIRAVFLLPLLLCLAGWALSITHVASLTYTHAYTVFNCNTIHGALWFRRDRNPPPLDAWATPDGWQAECFAYTSKGQFWPRSEPGSPWPACLGFTCEVSTDHFAVQIPYWFLIPIASLLLFVAWRKTAPKKPGGAFPVETTAKKE